MAASLFCVIITTLGLKQWADWINKVSLFKIHTKNYIY